MSDDLVNGTHSVTEEDELLLNTLEVFRSPRRSVKYSGAQPLMHLKIMSIRLKTIRCLTGNQCKLYKRGVTWSNFLAPETSFAAAFWTRWSLHILLEGKNNLQKTRKQQDSNRGPLGSLTSCSNHYTSCCWNRKTFTFYLQENKKLLPLFIFKRVGYSWTKVPNREKSPRKPRSKLAA